MTIRNIIQNNESAVFGKGASEKVISNAESALGLAFAKDYKDYLAQFGAVMINGHAITGISKSKSLDVVIVTKREREYNESLPADMYVIEDTGFDEILILQDTKGRIYQESFGKIVEICKSLEEYFNRIIED